MSKVKLDQPLEDYYFPINLDQFRNLLGKVLTHIEALGLPERVEKANKDLLRQSLWHWWDTAVDNSITSYKGCVAPIQVGDTVYRWLADGKFDLPVS